MNLGLGPLYFPWLLMSPPSNYLVFHFFLNERVILIQVRVADNGQEDGAVIFASDLQIRTLGSCTVLYCDGTFKSCPTPFKQLYVVHVNSKVRFRGDLSTGDIRKDKKITMSRYTACSTGDGCHLALCFWRKKHKVHETACFELEFEYSRRSYLFFFWI